VEGKGTLPLSSLPVDFSSITNLDYINTQDSIFDFGEDAVIANTILPKISEFGTLQSRADAMRIIQFGDALAEKLDDPLRNLSV